MKHSLLSVWVLLAFALAGCTKTVAVEPTLDPKTDPLKNYTQNLQQAQDWLPGKWKLAKVYAMIPEPAVPNVELVVDTSQIRVIEDGSQIDVVDYALVKRDSSLIIQTNA
ncbi:hypothetical protein [Spirosoma sp. 48-14]|uniref:hypothetical protein n=1 Tax=Spirosoma sp. 48-14 TaxID=1895854 RepID=UPI000968B37B|nr:hypothetical protein [Spirosoma sp. 48-14]OJW76279.1 MAG: hypothetical protein BGO59_22430 [Spirosoma sp. 48-14]